MEQNFIIILIIPKVKPYLGNNAGISNEQVLEMETYIKKLSNSFYLYTNFITKHKEIRDSFSKSPGSSIEDINPENAFNDVIIKINDSFTKRIEAIYKIATNAEELALGYYSQPQSQFNSSDYIKPDSFYNAKTINPPPPEKNKTKDDDDDSKLPGNCSAPVKVELINSTHFKSEINMSFTSVHIPTSLNECDPKVLHDLKWSSGLEDIFKDNLNNNPLLSYQYFGSATGFMRQYPATKWRNSSYSKPDFWNTSNKPKPDLFDCRFRPWYTLSATSPKNIVILQDVSGSMTGMRSKIAKSIVNSILDTLTVNDYVNVFTCTDKTKVLVECYNNSELVQATSTNIRQLRIGLERTITLYQADLKKALNQAFDTLNHTEEKLGSANCNQAIMLITDGIQEIFQDIKDLFQTRNPDKKIRLFTYLVGKEVTKYQEVRLMACSNQGYYVHVRSLAEVQEQVLKYIPVMSRPLVMSQDRSVMWTEPYADVSEVLESEWDWTYRMREVQKERSKRYQEFLDIHLRINLAKDETNKSKVLKFSDGEFANKEKKRYKYVKSKVVNFLDYGYAEETINKTFLRDTNSKKELRKRVFEYLRDEFDPFKYNFMISVSFPVYDVRNFTNQTGRIANLLGVVGTDIPLEEIKHLISPFRLGVNAYAIIITNNGHVVLHPDYRPLYDGILKSTYDSVDLTEVELIDDDNLHRNNDSELMKFRENMVNSEDLAKPRTFELKVRIHRDEFTRAHQAHHRYTYGKIPKTTYTLALQIPINSSRFIGEIDLSRFLKENANAMEKYFNFNFSKDGDDEGEMNIKWKLHPDWIYCEYLNKALATKEEVFALFVNKIQSAAGNSFSWGNEFDGREGEFYRCDRGLVQSVIFDAKATQIFAASEKVFDDPILIVIVATNRAELLKESTLIRFVATRSGLTRWMDPPPSPILGDRCPRRNMSDIDFEFDFVTEHPRTIDESYYKRAVEMSKLDPESYVISVEGNAGVSKYPKATVSKAIIAQKGMKKAVVGVVGVQFELNLFLKHWGVAPESKYDERNICQLPDYDCFILDDNGIIIGSKNREDSGRFIGEIDGNILTALLNSTIYKMIIIRDFQGTCTQNMEFSNFASKLITPWIHMKELLKWLLSYLISFSMYLNIDFVNGETEYIDDKFDNPEDLLTPKYLINFAKLNKTKLRPCDKEYKLYNYGNGYYNTEEVLLEKRSCTDIYGDTCEDYLTVFRIPYTNLIYVIVKAVCRSIICNKEPPQRIDPIEIHYPIFKQYENKSHDPVYQELCRIPRSRTMHRRKPENCYKSDEDELDMKEDCGFGAIIISNPFLVFLVLLMTPATDYFLI